MSLLEQLSNLEAAGLISLARTTPEIEYLFQHTLIQEAAYDSLLKSERGRLHLAAGLALETLYPDKLGELALPLADHFRLAGEKERAWRYYRMAAEKAARSYANREAILSYSRAIETAPDPSTQADMMRARGLIFEITGEFENARADQEAALELAQMNNNPRGEWEALTNLGMLWAARDYQQTGSYYHRALDIARSLGEDRLMARSLNSLGNYHVNIEEPVEARQYHEEALAIFSRLNDLEGLAETTDLLGTAISLDGSPAQAWEYLQRSIQLFENLGNQRRLSSSLTMASILISDYQTSTVIAPIMTIEEGIRLAERGLRIATETGWRSGEAFSLGCLLYALTTQGSYERAFATAEQGLEIAREIKHQQWEILLAHASGMLHQDILDLEGAKVLYEQGLALASANHSKHWFHAIGGLLLSNLVQQGDLPGAHALDAALLEIDGPARTLGQRLIWCGRADMAIADRDPERALEIVELLVRDSPAASQGIMIRPWQIKAEALMAIGKSCPEGEERFRLLADARDLLQAALKEAEALHFTVRTWHILQSLARVLALQGKTVEAEQTWNAAREQILELSRQIPDEHLRAQYLSRALKEKEHRP